MQGMQGMQGMRGMLQLPTIRLPAPRYGRRMVPVASRSVGIRSRL